MELFVKWIACTVAVVAAAWIVPGFAIGLTAQSWIAVAAVGLALALLGKLLMLLLQRFGLQESILAVAVALLVMNIVMLYLASWLLDGMLGIVIVFLGMGSVLAASVIVSLVCVAVHAAWSSRSSAKDV